MRESIKVTLRFVVHGSQHLRQRKTNRPQKKHYTRFMFCVSVKPTILQPITFAADVDRRRMMKQRIGALYECVDQWA